MIAMSIVLIMLLFNNLAGPASFNYESDTEREKTVVFALFQVVLGAAIYFLVGFGQKLIRTGEQPSRS